MCGGNQVHIYVLDVLCIFPFHFEIVMYCGNTSMIFDV